MVKGKEDKSGEFQKMDGRNGEKRLRSNRII